MKIERLLKILFYLLNRELVSGSELATEFGVSRRTIMRDIDTLSLAGIPIYAEAGVKGGYRIHDDYQLNGKILTKTNAQYLLLALNSLQEVYGDTKIRETYEKVAHIFKDEHEPGIFELDFSVISENKQVMEDVGTIKEAIIAKQGLRFDYTSHQSGQSTVVVDPIHLAYKWYAWYLFAYAHEKQEIRQYKLVRMEDIAKIEQGWQRDYDVPKILEEVEAERQQTYTTVRIRYPKRMKVLVEEYLPGELVTEEEDFLITNVKMRTNNFMMFSLLLGFGDQLQVLGPPAFLTQFKAHLDRAQKNNL